MATTVKSKGRTEKPTNTGRNDTTTETADGGISDFAFYFLLGVITFSIVFLLVLFVF